MFPDSLSDKVPHLVDLSADTNLEEVLADQSIRAIRPAIDRVTEPPAYQESLADAALTAASVGAEGESRVAQAVALREEVTEQLARS
jgi:hypothetical protein